MAEPHDNGSPVTRRRVAVVTLTYDLEAFRLQISGTCPTTELAKAICLMAADECDARLKAKRAAHALTVATPDFLASLKGG